MLLRIEDQTRLAWTSVREAGRIFLGRREVRHKAENEATKGGNKSEQLKVPAIVLRTSHRQSAIKKEAACARICWATALIDVC